MVCPLRALPPKAARLICKDIPYRALAHDYQQADLKAQTTAPQAVRAALRLREGDEIVYTIEDGRVLLTNAEAPVADDPFATFGEWDSEADRKAYAKL